MEQNENSMFPTLGGDSFLVRFSHGVNVLVDMRYNEHIKDILHEIKRDKEVIDLLVITHIDENHIFGAIEFINDNQNVETPNVIEVKEVWFNSFRHLQFDKNAKAMDDYEIN